MRAADGSVAPGELRVRFGEVEARGIALTPAGRDAVDPLPPDPAAWAAAIPGTERELARAGLAWFTAAVSASAADLAAAGRRAAGRRRRRWSTTAGCSLDPVVYEDFLPRSAAGIFRSNLADDGARRRDRGRRRAGRRRGWPVRSAATCTTRWTCTPRRSTRRGHGCAPSSGWRRDRRPRGRWRAACPTARCSARTTTCRRTSGRGAASRAAPRSSRGRRASTRSARWCGGRCGTGCRWCRRGRTPGWSARRCPGPAARSGVLSTERLVAPLEVHVDDRAVTAGAGVLLSGVAAAVAPHGLELPIDLSADASVGGVVATNAGGCRVLRHGDVRRRLLGVQVVLADDDATVLGDLRPLRKKNDSLRLTDLRGRLGRAARCRDGGDARARAPAGRAGHRAAAAARVAARRGVRAGAGARAAARRARADLGGGAAAHGPARRVGERPVPRADARAWPLLVEAEGDGAREALLAALESLGDLVEDAALLPVERAWGLRHSVSEALARAGTVLGLDVSLPRAALVAARAEAADVVRRQVPGAVLADFGHLGDGGLHLNVVLPDGLRPRGRDGAAGVGVRAGRPARRLVLRRARPRARPTSPGGRRTSSRRPWPPWPR